MNTCSYRGSRHLAAFRLRRGAQLEIDGAHAINAPDARYAVAVLWEFDGEVKWPSVPFLTRRICPGFGAPFVQAGITFALFGALAREELPDACLCPA